MLYGPTGFIPLGIKAVLGQEGLLQVGEASLTPLREPGISPEQLADFSVVFDCLWKVPGNSEILLEKLSKSKVFVLQPAPDLLPGACTTSSKSQRGWT